MNWKFDLFGLNSMRDAPKEDLPEHNGVLRYFQVLWDHLGKLLLANILCFLGFLPGTLGLSLGLIYENFWLALAGGLLGGAIAAPFWTSMIDLALHCYQGAASEWFGCFRRTLLRTLRTAAGQGAVLGAVVAGLLSVGGFCVGLMEAGTLPALPVWVVLTVDFLLTALAASLLFPPLCFEKQPFSTRIRTALSMLITEPVRLLATALGLLLWCALGVALFPVSIPFAVLLGFWPVALLTAQLQRPALLDRFGTPESFSVSGGETRDGGSYTFKQRGEIWWRRHWGIAVAVLVCLSLGLGVVQTFSSMQEPDLQIAVVYGTFLPDAVIDALQSSLAEVVGDLNGDGAAIVQVNAYQVVFDGNVENADLQAAGSTLLVTDLADHVSSLFLVEDADGFLALYGDLVEAENALTWEDYPVLAALDAGTYSTVEDISTDNTGQALLAGYTVFPLREGNTEALSLLLQQ